MEVATVQSSEYVQYDGAKPCHDEHDDEDDGPKSTINEDDAEYDATKWDDGRKGYDEQVILLEISS